MLLSAIFHTHNWGGGVLQKKKKTVPSAPRCPMRAISGTADRSTLGSLRKPKLALPFFFLHEGLENSFSSRVGVLKGIWWRVSLETRRVRTPCPLPMRYAGAPVHLTSSRARRLPGRCGRKSKETQEWTTFRNAKRVIEISVDRAIAPTLKCQNHTKYQRALLD